MSHCPKCEKIIEVDEKGKVTEVHPDCPGCGHEAELAALRASLTAAETALAATKYHWCAYCNFGDEAQQSLEDLQAHLRICEYHPMRKLQAALDVADEMVKGLDVRKYLFENTDNVKWARSVVARFHEAREKVGK